MIMIDKLLWYDYGKPCFYSFKGEGKEHKGAQKKKSLRRKEEEEIKDSTSPGYCVDPVSRGGVQILRGATFTAIFSVLTDS